MCYVVSFNRFKATVSTAHLVGLAVTVTALAAFLRCATWYRLIGLKPQSRPPTFSGNWSNVRITATTALVAGFLRLPFATGHGFVDSANCLGALLRAGTLKPGVDEIYFDFDPVPPPFTAPPRRLPPPPPPPPSPPPPSLCSEGLFLTGLSDSCGMLCNKPMALSNKTRASLNRSSCINLAASTWCRAAASLIGAYGSS